jgi:two-component system KDP operon response regulator KdpE
VELKSKVLVVEDDAGIRQSLFETLGALGFAIGEACNGEEALLRLRMVNYDAVLLDINMPGIGGKETCRRICHSYPRLPIIMLTVRDDEKDKVEALDAGAYDYVTKPFHITLDCERRLVQKRGEDIHLAPKQYETLCYLMEHAGHPVPHERLLASVWGPLYGNEREYLRVIINQLRKKIEDDPAHPTYILTETHIGYRFRKG